MTDSADPAALLHDLGRATSRLIEAALAQLSPEGREAVAELLLAEGTKMVVVVDVHPRYAARVVLHRKGKDPVILCALMAEVPAEQTH